MPTLHRATFPEDAPHVEDIMRRYVDDLVRRIPNERGAILTKYAPDRLPGLVAEWHHLHARPKGDMLLAWNGPKVVGCGMMRHLDESASELQRLFVDAEARGTGLGRDLCTALMAQAKADGRRVMRLDTGPELTEAIALYRRLGFREIPAYHNETPYLAHAMVYFECVL